ncbi:helix-turn-helix transcriptional regulator [Frigidibacter sp. MR17.14]|uniref:helix-turn-helix domain-containing protein n=1 Tax=Frigidibacter sp. MR17.14 TaxID=3126509 RepID=UPI003012DB68
MTVHEQIDPGMPAVPNAARNRRIAQRMIGRGVSPVAAWRMTLGLRRMDLAARARVDIDRLALIERRECPPVRQELSRLCAALEVTDRDLAEQEAVTVRTRMFGAH